MQNSIAVQKSVTVNSMQELANRFAEYIDVSVLSMKSYNSGVKKFLTFLHENAISQPTRETVLLYKKNINREIQRKYSSPLSFSVAAFL